VEANRATGHDGDTADDAPDGRTATATRGRDQPESDPATPPAPGETGGGLAPLPYDGVRSVTAGTVLWLIALIVLIPFTDDLRRDGHLWWLATAACGFGLGLLGIVIVVRRRARIRRGERPTGD
jgi:hypothetical protein